jgi:hypothetical protein
MFFVHIDVCGRNEVWDVIGVTERGGMSFVWRGAKGFLPADTMPRGLVHRPD